MMFSKLQRHPATLLNDGEGLMDIWVAFDRRVVRMLASCLGHSVYFSSFSSQEWGLKQI